MSVEPHLLPTHSAAIFNSTQAKRTVTRIALNPSTANSGDVLYITVPKLTQDVVMVPGSLALVFDIPTAMTFTKSSMIFSYLFTSVTRCLWRESRVRSCARSVPILATSLPLG